MLETRGLFKPPSHYKKYYFAKKTAERTHWYDCGMIVNGISFASKMAYLYLANLLFVVYITYFSLNIICSQDNLQHIGGIWLRRSND